MVSRSLFGEHCFPPFRVGVVSGSGGFAFLFQGFWFAVVFFLFFRVVFGVFFPPFPVGFGSFFFVAVVVAVVADLTSFIG